MNYFPIEYHCLALLCMYFLVHCLKLIIKSDTRKYLLSWPAMSRRIARCLFQLNEFGITVMTPRELRSLLMSNLLAHLFFEEHDIYVKTCLVKRYASLRTVNDALPLSILPHIKETAQESYYKILMALPFLYLLARAPLFKQWCWVWSLVIRLISVLQLGIWRLYVQKDSRLII